MYCNTTEGSERRESAPAGSLFVVGLLGLNPPPPSSDRCSEQVVVLGDKGVGKTCLVLRFIEGYFAPKQQSTIGAFFLTKKIT